MWVCCSRATTKVVNVIFVFTDVTCIQNCRPSEPSWTITDRAESTPALSIPLSSAKADFSRVLQYSTTLTTDASVVITTWHTIEETVRLPRALIVLPSAVCTRFRCESGYRRSAIIPMRLCPSAAVPHSAYEGPLQSCLHERGDELSRPAVLWHRIQL